MCLAIPWTSIKRASSSTSTSKPVGAGHPNARCADKIKLQPTIRHPISHPATIHHHTPLSLHAHTRAYTQEADAGREPSATQDTGLTCRLTSVRKPAHVVAPPLGASQLCNFHLPTDSVQPLPLSLSQASASSFCRYKHLCNHRPSPGLITQPLSVHPSIAFVKVPADRGAPTAPPSSCWLS